MGELTEPDLTPPVKRTREITRANAMRRIPRVGDVEEDSEELTERDDPTPKKTTKVGYKPSDATEMNANGTKQGNVSSTVHQKHDKLTCYAIRFCRERKSKWPHMTRNLTSQRRRMIMW